jgi:hypothetical protein
MINTERLLKEAREQDHTCEFCYYECFDDKAYPCSRCVCNQPTENMWRPKIKDEPQTDCDHKCIQMEIGCEETDCPWK